MGAENSILSNVEWGEKYNYTSHEWTIENGELENGIEISMFSVVKKESKYRELLRKLAKQLKSIRHPAILHYIEFQEGTHGPFLITEQVVPLQHVLGSLSSVEICSGLQAILEALAFLHDKAGLSHNNVCLKSIYVCKDGSWRLGGLEHACRFSEATAGYLQSCRAFRCEEALAPEEKQEKIEMKPELGHTRDVYGFAILADELLEKLNNLGDMTKTFELRIQDECLNPDPRMRPKTDSLLSDRLFTTEFLEIATFLKNITLKNEEERKSFFMNLMPKLMSVSEDLLGRRLVPLMLSRFVLLDQTACQFLLPHLLTPCLEENLPTKIQEGITSLLTLGCYKKYVIPKLVKIFRVHDHHIRMVLLKYFSLYVQLVDQEVLEFEIFPQILLGLRDTSEELAEASLRALADLIPILGRDVIIGGKTKNYFRKGMPKALDGNSGGSINMSNSVTVVSNMANNVDSAHNMAKNVNTIVSKPLLKDMAKHSVHHSPRHITEEEKDRKWKEREKRREEAKLRREQRKLERESRQKEMRNSASKEDASEERDEAITEDSKDSHIPIDRLDTGSLSANTTDDWSKESFSEVNNTTERTHSIESEGEKDDWSDWENADIESQISDEIERELEAMQLEENVSQDKNDIHSDDNFRQKRTTTKLDRSPVHSKKGAMKLEKVKPSSSGGDNISDKTESPMGTFQSKPHTQKHSTVKSVTINPNIDLGAEFDIKSVQIKVDSAKKADPFDFFSDMAPTISYVKPVGDMDVTDDLVPNLVMSEDKNLKDGAKAKSVSFDVIQSIDEADTGDWGDDWGGEDF